MSPTLPWLALALLALSPLPLHSEEPAPAAPSAPTPERQLVQGWVLPRGERSRARPSLPADPIEWAYLQGKLAFPDPASDPSSDTAPSADGLPAWKKVAANPQGQFDGKDIGGGWLLTYCDSPQDQVWLLDAQGHGAVRVNGSPRVGDVYANGKVETPILLRAGQNTLLFTSGRGPISAKLRPAPKDLFFSARDSTFPHILRGENQPLWGAILLVNATTQTRSGLQLTAAGPGFRDTLSALPSLPPLSTRKVAFQLQPDPAAPTSTWTAEKLPIVLTLRASDQLADSTSLSWDVRNPSQTHLRTFQSQIDGSIQYYGVVPPAANSALPNQPPGLLLSLHGAGVEGAGQADVYRPQPNTYVITPTNRRNFGFDWEDWGRWDALEVLELARARFATDPRRTWLSGHSMGGHGTWHIGSLFPDRFAAVGPSAGWISFNSYAGRPPEPSTDPVTTLLRRPLSVGDTLARSRNLQHQGVYILHGDADDNVPVDQARTMRAALAAFHPDFVYKEQPGANHWWGNPCCDWPPMMQFFQDRTLRLPRDVSDLHFLTPSPAASAHCFWATIENQNHQEEISELALRYQANPLTISGTTKNVARLTLHPSLLQAPDAPPSTSLSLDLDGSNLPNLPLLPHQSLSLARSPQGWQLAPPSDALRKSPQRSGTFKTAFQNRFLLVYGTAGSPDENAWMLDRARHDAEVFWYRGNGSVDVVPDSAWKTIAETDRSVIVYGNASINAAWRELLADSPIDIRRDAWQTPSSPLDPTPVACLLVRPRPHSLTASVAAIGGTHLAALRATDRLPLFSSGTGYPDLLLVAPDYLQNGAAAVKLTGYFGQDWSFAQGEWAGPSAPR